MPRASRSLLRLPRTPSQLECFQTPSHCQQTGWRSGSSQWKGLVLTEPDLLRRHNSLDRLRPANLANYGTYLQEAWDEIQIRLLEGGRRPQLIMSPWSLRQVHIDKTLEIIYRDFMTLAGDGNYAKLAEFYGEQFEANWNKLVLTYDYDEEGSPGDAEEGVAVEPVTYLTAGPSGLSTYVPGDLY